MGHHEPMPKITSATVAEHRVAQRAALIRAGEETLLAEGLAGFHPTSVSKRAAMARSSFYDYFATKDDLLVAIAIEAMGRWGAQMEEELKDVAPGLPQLQAFVDATMRMAGDGQHRLADMVKDAHLSPSSVDDLMVLHEALLSPVARVLTDVGADASGNSVMLVQGVLSAGVQLVAHGVDPQDAARDAYRMLTSGLFG